MSIKKNCLHLARESSLIVSYDVSMIAIPEEYDRSSFFDESIVEFSQMGYDDVYAKKGCMNDEFLQSYLTNSKVAIVRTHGLETWISTSNAPWGLDTEFSLPENSFNGVDPVVYGCCLSGATPSGTFNGEPKSLAEATVEAGATTVIGFNDIVYAAEVNSWCAKFIEFLGRGWDVDDAAETACDSSNFVEGTKVMPLERLVIYGNGDLTIPVVEE